MLFPPLLRRPAPFRTASLSLTVLMLGGLAAPLPAEQVFFNGQDHQAGYYLVPDNMPEDGAKVWVVVDVHGAGGLRGAGRGGDLAKLLAPEPVIVIVPSFTNGYQAGDGQYARQMLDNFKTVRERHAVHDKMFVHGHSGGAQFAHRFAFNEPGHVAGVSAHSAGSWACAGGYGKISARAKGIPFTISCGENDTAYSVAGDPHTRIAWYKLFEAEMEKKGFVFAGQTWPGVGHGVSSRLYGPQLRECFLLATRGEAPTSGKWKGDVEKLAQAVRREMGSASGLAVRRATLGDRDLATLRAANEKISSGDPPDTAATLRFLMKYPASSWAAREELAALKAHCRQAARTYLDEKEAEGAPLAGVGLEKFRRVTEGLGLEN